MPDEESSRYGKFELSLVTFVVGRVGGEGMKEGLGWVGEMVGVVWYRIVSRECECVSECEVWSMSVSAFLFFRSICTAEDTSLESGRWEMRCDVMRKWTSRQGAAESSRARLAPRSWTRANAETNAQSLDRDPQEVAERCMQKLVA